MQAWQSILLIILTLLLFGGGLYYDKVKKDSFISYDELNINDTNTTVDPVESNSSNGPMQLISQTNSNVWATSTFIIELPKNNQHLLNFHREAILGNPFVTSVIQILNKNPTAKKIIFSPFLNDIFIESEVEILRSLFSADQISENYNQLLVTVKGHSRRSSRVLFKVILDEYKKYLKAETREKPLSPLLVKQKEKIDSLRNNYLQLAEQIQEENEGSSVQSIEEIALKSELAQTKDELNSYAIALEKIERKYQKNRPKKEYLEINSLANFGSIREVSVNIEELNKLLLNQSLESALKSEIKKNLQNLENSFNQEIAKGISRIKDNSREALDRKKNLQKKLTDISLSKDNIHALHPKYKLLKSVKNELDKQEAEFHLNFRNWERAKQGIIFKEEI